MKEMVIANETGWRKVGEPLDVANLEVGNIDLGKLTLGAVRFSQGDNPMPCLLGIDVQGSGVEVIDCRQSVVDGFNSMTEQVKAIEDQVKLDEASAPTVLRIAGEEGVKRLQIELDEKRVEIDRLKQSVLDEAASPISGVNVYRSYNKRFVVVRFDTSRDKCRMFVRVLSLPFIGGEKEKIRILDRAPQGDRSMWMDINPSTRQIVLLAILGTIQIEEEPGKKTTKQFRGELEIGMFADDESGYFVVKGEANGNFGLSEQKEFVRLQVEVAPGSSDGLGTLGELCPGIKNILPTADSEEEKAPAVLGEEPVDDDKSRRAAKLARDRKDRSKRRAVGDKE